MRSFRILLLLSGYSWAYDDETAFTGNCATAEQKSPIDIYKRQPVSQSDLNYAFEFLKETLSVKIEPDSTYGLKLTSTDDKDFFQIEDDKYKLKQMTLKFGGAEHHPDYWGELQFELEGSPNLRYVLFLDDSGNGLVHDNNINSKLSDLAKGYQNKVMAETINFADFNKVLGFHSTLLLYYGTTTEPPCNKVAWYFFGAENEHVIKIDNSLKETFKGIFSGSRKARSLQTNELSTIHKYNIKTPQSDSGSSTGGSGGSGAGGAGGSGAGGSGAGGSGAGGSGAGGAGGSGAGGAGGSGAGGSGAGGSGSGGSGAGGSGAGGSGAGDSGAGGSGAGGSGAGGSGVGGSGSGGSSSGGSGAGGSGAGGSDVGAGSGTDGGGSDAGSSSGGSNLAVSFTTMLTTLFIFAYFA